MSKLLVVGESLFDFVKQPNKELLYKAIPGGSPFNTALAVARLGIDVEYAYPFSNDKLGELLKQTLLQSGVKISKKNEINKPTPITIASVNSDKEVSYQYYNKGTIDEEIDDQFITECLKVDFKILHIGGRCLSNCDNIEKWMRLLKEAKSKGAIISIDPNIRANVIKDKNSYIQTIKSAFALADIIRCSDKDCNYLFNNKEIYEIIKTELKHLSLFIITEGEKGAHARLINGAYEFVKSYFVKNIKDTIGAGDCFQAAVLKSLLDEVSLDHKKDLEKLNTDIIKKVLKFAHGVSAFNCKYAGCNPPFFHQIKS